MERWKLKTREQTEQKKEEGRKGKEVTPIRREDGIKRGRREERKGGNRKEKSNFRESKQNKKREKGEKKMWKLKTGKRADRI